VGEGGEERGEELGGLKVKTSSNVRQVSMKKEGITRSHKPRGLCFLLACKEGASLHVMPAVRGVGGDSKEGAVAAWWGGVRLLIVPESSEGVCFKGSKRGLGGVE
jgi:hypothetical protein